jgi:AraC family transcriptional activator of tynA and feaB
VSAEQGIRRWSTSDLPAGSRFDCWMNIIRESLWPVSDWSVPENNFAVEMREASLGGLVSVQERICAHESHRTRLDVERSTARCYSIFVSLEPTWGVEHRGLQHTLRPGDVMLVDSQAQLKTFLPVGFHGVILKCPVEWMHTWLSEPELLAGTVISCESTWGSVLSPLVMQLNPEVACAPPLPGSVLLDQLGATLALVAGDTEQRSHADILKRLKDCIRERCTDSSLTAADIAEHLNVPVRLLHRLLAAQQTTFATLLVDTRLNVAAGMLRSRALNHVTIGEIARRAGFSSLAHFTQVMRKRTGCAPADLRCLSS